MPGFFLNLKFIKFSWLLKYYVKRFCLYILSYMRLFYTFCKESLWLLILQNQVPWNNQVLVLIFESLNLKHSRDLWSSTKVGFPWYLWKIFFSIYHFLCSQPCCKLKQQHIGNFTFQHCQIFVSSFWSKQENKRTLKLSACVIHLVQLPDFYFLKYELRIHPLS